MKWDQVQKPTTGCNKRDTLAAGFHSWGGKVPVPFSPFSRKPIFT
jgi:hypothetical protein